MESLRRVVVWFSCGAASAVAAKISVERFGKERPVDVCYCDLSEDEHPDNARFLADVERWIERPIIKLRSHRYSRIDDVFLGERFIRSPSGAPCTKLLKRHVRERYERPDDIVVIGYTSDECERIAGLEAISPHTTFLWVLAQAGISKADCYRIVKAAGIELPVMYKLGYGHNNCIGCVKGGAGYWNKIRRDFPEVFARRAMVEREVGYSILKCGWLDELDPEAGRDVPQPNIECGLFCARYTDLIHEASRSTHAHATGE